MSKRILAFQIAILAACAGAVMLLILNFPYPSPLVRPFLPAPLRWPEAQVKQWVEAQDFDPGYLEFFARDPDRTVPSGDNFVSPSDGLVKYVTFRDGITYLVIALSFWDVHVVRTPVAGIVRDISSEGSYYSRNDSPAELHESFFLRGKPAPVQQVVTLSTSKGLVRVRLITSYWASRLRVWSRIGERVSKGERIGRILLGSTVVFELPGQVALSVKPGERVVGGETIVWRNSP